MAKRASHVRFSQIKFDADQDPWIADIDASVSPTGKRYRPHFATEALARTACEEAEANHANLGRAALSPKEEIDARANLNRLPENVSLSDVVSDWLKAQEIQRKSLTWLEMFDEFLVCNKERMCEQYRKEMGFLRNRHKELHDKLVCNITHTDLNKILDTLTPGARRALIKNWNTVLKFGIPRGYLDKNPLDLVVRVPRVHKDVEIFTALQVEAILNYALRDYLEVVPYLVFGLFCGVRSNSELLRMRWEDIVDGVLILRRGITKTKNKRNITLSELAPVKPWLDAYEARGGNTKTGLVCPFSSDERNYRQRQCANAANMDEWIHSGMRHTFATNYLKVHPEADGKLRELMGHESQKTLFKHYVGETTLDDARAFWALRPPPIGGQRIVPLFTHEEQWKPVDGFPGYEVSNHGSVCLLERVSGSVKLLDDQVGEIRAALADGANQYRLAEQYGVSQSQISFISQGKRKERFSQYKDGRRILKSRKPTDRADLIVMLIRDGKKEYRPVHVLVAGAFLPPAPSPNHLVHHRDLCAHNNRANNLEWIPIGKLISFAKRRKAGYGVQASLKREKAVDLAEKSWHFSGTNSAAHYDEGVADHKVSISA
jgi:integrase